MDGIEGKARRGGFKLDGFPWSSVLDQLTVKGTASINVNVFVTHMLARRRAYKAHALTILNGSDGSPLTRKSIAPFTSIKRDFIFPSRGKYKTRLSDVQYYSTMTSGLAFEDDPFAVAESHRSDVFAPDSDVVFEESADALD